MAVAVGAALRANLGYCPIIITPSLHYGFNHPRAFREGLDSNEHRIVSAFDQSLIANGLPSWVIEKVRVIEVTFASTPTLTLFLLPRAGTTTQIIRVRFLYSWIIEQTRNRLSRFTRATSKLRQATSPTIVGDSHGVRFCCNIPSH